MGGKLGKPVGNPVGAAVALPVVGILLGLLVVDNAAMLGLEEGAFVRIDEG